MEGWNTDFCSFDQEPQWNGLYSVDHTFTIMEESDLLERALRAKGMGRYDEAIEAYNTALLHNPRNTAIMESMGDIYYEMGRHEEALAKYGDALTIEPRNLLVLYKKRLYPAEDSPLRGGHAVLRSRSLGRSGFPVCPQRQGVLSERDGEVC